MNTRTSKLPLEVENEVRGKLLEDIAASREHAGQDESIARQLQDRDCELDVGDIAEAAAARVQLASTSQHTSTLLDESLAALERLDAGEYGMCEGCGTAINHARLCAIPRTRRCVECQQRESQRD